MTISMVPVLTTQFFFAPLSYMPPKKKKSSSATKTNSVKNTADFRRYLWEHGSKNKSAAARQKYAKESRMRSVRNAYFATTTDC